jgi:hypothetical protein
MKVSSLILVGMMTLSFNLIADEKPKGQTQKPNQGNVESLVKEAKSSRKKKVEMCHDCGKPESQCTCEGEEHKKDESHDH